MNTSKRVVLALAVLQVLVHLVPHAEFGLFRDELYYLACARRPALGYVDHPPLAPWLLALQLPLTGDSLLALRLQPALLGGATVLLAADLARRLGGGGFARVLAALAVGFAPIDLILFDFFSMNALEVLLWTASAWAFVRLTKERDPRWWLAIGALLGLALLGKHTAGLWGAALGLGLVASAERRWLATRWPWLGAVLALALLLPNLLWQVREGWPSLEFYANASEQKNIATAPLELLGMQVLVQGPGALPIWIAGLWFLLRRPEGAPWRALGWAWLVLVLLMILAASSRADRLAGAFPFLMAAGAVHLERVSRRPRRAWLRGALVSSVVLSGLLLAPIGLSAVSPRITARYTSVLGGRLEIEAGKRASLPQWLADRCGWRELAAEFARALAALPEEDQAGVLLLAGNYGEAGALEYFAGELGLPQVISGHNSYHSWSRGRTDAERYLVVGFSPATLERLFGRVQQVGGTRCEYCMEYENGLPVWLASEPRVPLSVVWDQLEAYG